MCAADSPFQTDREQSARVGNIAACVVKREVGEMFADIPSTRCRAPRDSGFRASSLARLKRVASDGDS